MDIVPRQQQARQLPMRLPYMTLVNCILSILVILYNWLYFVSDATVYGGNRHGRNRIGHLALNLLDLGKSWYTLLLNLPVPLSACWTRLM